MCATLWLYGFRDTFNTHKDRTEWINAFTGKHNGTDVTKSVLREEQKLSQLQLANFRGLCSEQGLLARQGSNSSYSVLYARKYNLACVAVPKIGSTVLKQIFYLLNFGADRSHKILQSSRFDIQFKTGNLSYSLKHSELLESILLVPARNPYSRLYAAYIDKVFLPLSLSLGKSVLYETYMKKLQNMKNKSEVYSLMRRRPSCSTNVSFVHFIDFALTGPFPGKAMFDHFGPVTLLYKRVLCAANNTVVVKQETFVEVILKVLKLQGVAARDIDAIKETLTSRRADLTIRSVVETVFKVIQPHIDLSKSSSCWTWKLVVQRLWKSFKVQGIISEDATLPHFSEKDYRDKDFVVEMFTRASKEKPLTEEQSIEQRKRAMLEEYSSISDQAIEKIKQIYRKDFEIFKYSSDL